MAVPGQYTLEGLTDMALHGDFIYTVSSMDRRGQINVFRVEVDGGLTHQNNLKIAAVDGALGLGGVRAVWVTVDRLYTASFVDKAVTAFERNSQSGALTYLGHVKSGERQIARFPDPPQPSITRFALNETFTAPGDEAVG